MIDRAEIPVPSPGSAPNGFSLEIKRQRETAQLIPAGEVDLATAGQLQSELEKLIEAGFTRIVIDLRRIEFLDSSGLHALISAHARAQQGRWQLEIIPGPRAVQRIFEITGTIDRLPFIPCNGEASNSQISVGSPRLST